MELFKKIGLVQILDNGEIYLTQLELMVGSETSNAALMRERRKNNKLKNLQPNNNVNTMLENCYTEKETDKELDTELELEKHIDKNIDTQQDKKIDEEIDRDTESKKAKRRTSKKDKKKRCSSTLNKNSGNVIEESKEYIDSNYYDNMNGDVNKSVEDGVDLEVYKHFEKCGFNVSSRLMEFIAEDINVYGRKWVIEAANECVRKGKSNNYGYLTGILQNWSRNGHMDNSNGEIKANTSAYTPMTSILDE